MKCILRRKRKAKRYCPAKRGSICAICGGSKETLERAIHAYITIVDEMQDYIIFLYQETKSLSYEARKYIFRAEQEMAGIFEEILKQGFEASCRRLCSH